LYYLDTVIGRAETRAQRVPRPGDVTRLIPFKANPQGPAPPRKDRKHVYAIAAKAAFEIKFPRVERYTAAIRNPVAVDFKCRLFDARAGSLGSGCHAARGMRSTYRQCVDHAPVHLRRSTASRRAARTVSVWRRRQISKL
jgi:hypothetical protein